MRIKRKLVELLWAIFIVSLPFLKIGGESALRFDIPLLTLYFFGTDIRIEEFFIVLIATIFICLLFIFITLLFGRMWCGWLCPQTVLVDFTAFTDKFKKGFLYRLLSLFLILLISAVVGANLIWYFVSPYEFFGHLLRWELSQTIWRFWIVLTAIIFLNLVFIRRKFCVTVCPYSKLQSAMHDNKTLVIAFDPSKSKDCINCMSCVKKCPVRIDIRQGLHQACIYCGECIDACKDIMKGEGKNGESLINYSFGLPGEKGRIIRRSVVMVGFVTLAFLIFLIYLLAARG